MARVLVTGATGFIGKHLVEVLCSRGDEVTCLVRASSKVEPLQKLGVQFATGDITDPGSLAPAVANVDAVYDLAGRNKANNLAQYCQVNETGVRNLLQACARRTTPPVVVLISSLSAAGPMQEEQLRTESAPPAPVSDYGRSKRAGEIAAEAMAGEVPITVLRPPVVFGPGDVATLPLFRTLNKMGIHLMLGMGKRVSLIYVADLAAVSIAAVERGQRLPPPTSLRHADTTSPSLDAGRGYYFVAADKHPSYAELGTMIGHALGRKKIKFVRTPLAGVYALAAWNEVLGRFGRPQYLNFDRIREMTAGHWICSPAKAHQELGFTPAATLDDQLCQTAQWYRQVGWM